MAPWFGKKKLVNPFRPKGVPMFAAFCPHCGQMIFWDYTDTCSVCNTKTIATTMTDKEYDAMYKRSIGEAKEWRASERSTILGAGVDVDMELYRKVLEEEEEWDEKERAFRTRKTLQEIELEIQGRRQARENRENLERLRRHMEEGTPLFDHTLRCPNCGSTDVVEDWQMASSYPTATFTTMKCNRCGCRWP